MFEKIALVLFWTCSFLVIHTYFVYPILMRILALNSNKNNTVYSPSDDLPFVSIIIAAYNEESVIKEKIESIFANLYPSDKIEIYVGSDCSTDNTNKIVTELASKNNNLILVPFNERQGKIKITNALIRKAKGEIVVLTDANVFFGTDTIYNLIKHFKNERIGLVDSNMINKGLKKEGISIQEKSYIQNEVQTKNAEGKIWGCMIGPFGGCYAIRKNLFYPIPENFLVDDFYICMKILEKNHAAINETDALVYEDVSSNLSEEFRRKLRIATGNFQNLLHFKHLLFRFNALSFCFLSHKVLRWKGPFLIITAFVSAFLLKHLIVYKTLLYLLLILLLLPLIDLLFKSANIHLKILRYPTHFWAMNIAMFIGFFKFLSGVKSSVWKPTVRNQ